MAKYYAICIGGVGARILEGIVRLCECGHIKAEDDLNCIMVDVDKNNGNATRVGRLIASYSNCRKVLGIENNLEGANIFKTKIVGAGVGGTFSATPISTGADNVSIKKNLVTQRDEEANNIMKAFFTEDEYTRILDQGFYANPLIGSLFFNQALETQNNANNGIFALLSKIADEIRDGHVVKIFIAGSVFGGTGASGLLPLCNKLLNIIKDSAENSDMEKERRNNLHIFGCLMLPYFKYAEGTAPDDAIIDHKEFNETARYVLEGYNILINSSAPDKIFDKLYMIGDPDKTSRGVYSEQGSKQCNWPHILELFAASEAGRFFSETIMPTQDGQEPYAQPIVYADPFEIGGNSINTLHWGDYGKTDHSKSEQFQKSIEDFLLYNYYYSTYLIPLLYDFQGVAGKFFEPWVLDKKKNPKAKTRIAKLPNWTKNSFIEEEGGLFGLCAKKSWKYALSSEFAELYKYFTESAQWYYKIIHAFPATEGDKPCWDRAPEDVHECNLDTCPKNKPVLLSLFSSDGAKMLAQRACMPKKAFFMIDSESFLENIERNALLDGRDTPEFDSMQLGESTDRKGQSVFQELIRKSYEAVKATEKMARS